MPIDSYSNFEVISTNITISPSISTQVPEPTIAGSELSFIVNTKDRSTFTGKSTRDPEITIADASTANLPINFSTVSDSNYEIDASDGSAPSSKSNHLSEINIAESDPNYDENCGSAPTKGSTQISNDAIAGTRKQNHTVIMSTGSDPNYEISATEKPIPTSKSTQISDITAGDSDSYYEIGASDESAPVGVFTQIPDITAGGAYTSIHFTNLSADSDSYYEIGASDESTPTSKSTCIPEIAVVGSNTYHMVNTTYGYSTTSGSTQTPEITIACRFTANPPNAISTDPDFNNEINATTGNTSSIVSRKIPETTNADVSALYPLINTSTNSDPIYHVNAIEESNSTSYSTQLPKITTADCAEVVFTFGWKTCAHKVTISEVDCGREWLLDKLIVSIHPYSQKNLSKGQDIVERYNYRNLRGLIDQILRHSNTQQKAVRKERIPERLSHAPADLDNPERGRHDGTAENSSQLHERADIASSFDGKVFGGR
ncbi:hypothetical protein TSMEX_005939 [Taenia solium]|eukprot:TsM_001204300 transcript=TsM_001204300 gene=TsM_001204300